MASNQHSRPRALLEEKTRDPLLLERTGGGGSRRPYASSSSSLSVGAAAGGGGGFGLGPGAMAELFESYEEEFRSVAADAQRKASEALTYESNPEKRRGLLRQAEPLVQQLESLVKQMKVEVRSQDPATRAALSVKVQSYEKALASVKGDLLRAKEKEDKDALLGGSGGLSTEHRQRLLNANDRLANQNRTIENARKVMAETEQVGIQIGEELESNREKITNIRAKVMEVGGLTNTARRLISNISRRETQQKMLLWGVALALFIAIVLIIYYSSK